MANKLIASSGTITGLTKLMSEYFASPNIKIADGKVFNNRGQIGNLRVIKKAKRYRCERV